MSPNNQNQKQEQLSAQALDNLNFIEEEIEASSQYFKPKPGKVYMIKVNPEEKIEPRLNERFKTADGKPTLRYEVKITHVNSGKSQLWETSKTLYQQIVGELKKGFTVLKVERHGSNRSATYTIEGVQ